MACPTSGAPGRSRGNLGNLPKNSRKYLIPNASCKPLGQIAQNIIPPARPQRPVLAIAGARIALNLASSSRAEWFDQQRVPPVLPHPAAVLGNRFADIGFVVHYQDCGGRRR
jgi:hypothetical protein